MDFFHELKCFDFIDDANCFVFIVSQIFTTFLGYVEYWKMIWNICSKYSTVVIIFYALVISIDIISESTSILGHPCGTIDHRYKRVSIHNIKKFFSGGMLVMFKEVKIEISHDVTRILGHFLQYRMHCVIEIHNVAIWRAIYNTSYVCLTIKMNFCKYTFNMIINYIKFREMSVWKFFSYIQRHTTSPSQQPC